MVELSTLETTISVEKKSKKKKQKKKSNHINVAMLCMYTLILRVVLAWVKSLNDLDCNATGQLICEAHESIYKSTATLK